MAIYTFYGCRDDGQTILAEAHDLRADAPAYTRAETLLDEQRSWARVVVHEGERQVIDLARPSGPRAAGGSGPAAMEGVRGRLKTRAADSVAVIATQTDGAIVFWNRGAKRLYGWSESEALGRNVVEVTPAVQSRDQAAEIMERLGQGEAWSGEMLLRNREGGLLRAYVADLPISFDGEAQVVVGVSGLAERRPALMSYTEALRRELSGEA